MRVYVLKHDAPPDWTIKPIVNVYETRKAAEAALAYFQARDPYWYQYLVILSFAVRKDKAK